MGRCTVYKNSERQYLLNVVAFVAPVKLDIQVHGVVEVDVDEAKNRNWKEHTQNITPIL